MSYSLRFCTFKKRTFNFNYFFAPFNDVIPLSLKSAYPVTLKRKQSFIGEMGLAHLLPAMYAINTIDPLPSSLRGASTRKFAVTHVVLLATHSPLCRKPVAHSF